MKEKINRRSSQIVLIRKDTRHATLIRTYSLPTSFYNRRTASMRRRHAKDSESTEDQQICTKANCLTCCKKFTAFMFSRVGLFLVMMGYVAIGGVLFKELEAGNEANMRRIMEGKVDSTVKYLWEGILRVNSLPFDDKRRNFSLYAADELEKFEKIVVLQVQRGFDGRTTSAEHDWNYFGAVLYAVTLVSTIGYGHITTKTTQGKIATIFYSAFGIPLMMLFVANIGSTMARMFAFVFSRITMIFCCRMSSKRKRALVLKNRQKSNVLDGKLPITNEHIKSNLKPIKEELITTKKLPSSTNNSTTDIKQLPADIRLNMLTGIGSSNSNTSRSLTSSISSIGGEKSKDAIVRINELIRQDSVQNIGNTENHDEDLTRRKSIDISPIQYYINETNKLTSNLDNTPSTEKSNENDMKQIQTIPVEENVETAKDEKKKNLKRSKSETTHNRRANKKTTDNKPTTKDDQAIKPPRRRFFSRKNAKLKNEKKPIENEAVQISSPPPAYEQSTVNDITPIPVSTSPTTTVTWKGEHEFYPTIDLTNPDLIDDDDDFDEDEEMSVPLLVTVFVIPLYLTLGAILFSIWEQWSFLNSFYFCFITLTTIGFGDFVPGAALKVEAEKEKLISAAAYILFGLVLIAMCINLMKEQLSQKVKRVASKLGKF